MTSEDFSEIIDARRNKGKKKRIQKEKELFLIE